MRSVVITAIMFLCFAPFAFAADFSSTDFILRAPVVDDFGGEASSSGFQSVNAGSQSVTGESTSPNFIVRAGFLYFDEFSPRSQNWRFYDDEASETPASPLAAENTAPVNVVNQNVIKLRLTIKETAGVGDKNVKYRVQFSEYSDFLQGVTEVVELGSCVGNSLWCYADGGGADNGIISTKVLSDADVCAGGAGVGCGTHNESGVSASSRDHGKGAAAEYEFTLRQAGARANATYFFRAFDVGSGKPVRANASETYPSLSIEGAQFTLTIEGVSAGTVTEGITTDAATTPSAVPFGTLGGGVETEAAQRFVVTTNATAGYQIFAFERQPLEHVSYVGTTIGPLTGTNESPLSFAAGCSGDGCYGYHAGDDTLAGGSLRFSADDSYAQLTSGPKEVAHSSVPVENEATDVVFKIRVAGEQPAGEYRSALVYIATPAF